MKEVLEQQVERLVRLSFHDRIHLCADACQKRFSRITAQPASYRGRFDLLLVVEADPAIDLSFQHRVLAVAEHIDSAALTTRGYQPKHPSIVWTHNGGRCEMQSSRDAIAAFSGDERPCSQRELTAFPIQCPHLLKGGAVDSGSTILRGDYYFSLLWDQGYAELAAHHADDMTPGMRLLSRGEAFKES